MLTGGVIAAVLLAYLYFKFMHLQHDLEVTTQQLHQARTEVTLKESHILRLKAAVREQNERVEVLKQITEMRQLAIDQAREDIREMERENTARIARLKDTEGESCSDGIDLLDRDLGL